MTAIPVALGQFSSSISTTASNVVSVPRLDFVSTSATMHASVIHADETETAYALECMGGEDIPESEAKLACGIMGGATMTVNPSRISLNMHTDISSVKKAIPDLLHSDTVYSTYIGTSTAAVDCTVTTDSYTYLTYSVASADRKKGATCSGKGAHSFDIYVSTLGQDDLVTTSGDGKTLASGTKGGTNEPSTRSDGVVIPTGLPDLEQFGNGGIPVDSIWPMNDESNQVPVTITAGLEKLPTPTATATTTSSSSGAAAAVVVGAPLVTQAAVFVAGMAAAVVNMV